MENGQPTLLVLYTFILDNGKESHFSVAWPRQSFAGGNTPDWTALTYERCPHCRVPSIPGARCPVARDLAGVVEEFNHILSFADLTVRVNDGKRTYEKRCPAQEGLKSLMGLIMATSDCPTLAFLRPMAHFHLPFAQFEESVSRTVGAYLLSQYFRVRDGEVPDLALRGLAQSYGELQILNQSFAKRIRSAAEQDASMNAVIHLFALSNLVGTAIEDGLIELEPWYRSTGPSDDNVP